VCSWNTRTPFASSSTSSCVASKRYKQACSLLGRYDVVCVQETRGTQADIDLLRRDDRCRESEVHGSFVEASVSGGAVTVLSS